MADYDDPTSTDPAFFAVEHPSNTREHAHIADPVVYYDQEHHRFWVVAIEWKEKNIISFPLPFNYAHVQIAVSTTDTPANWMNINNTNNTTGNPSGHWYKYDFCLWEENGNCSNLHGVGHNQTIYVDDDTLYIAFLDDEGTTNVKSTTLMMVDKDTLMNGTATQTDAQFIQLKNIDDTWGHALAVEYDAWNNTDPVYTIVPEINSQIAFGFQDTLTLGDHEELDTPAHVRVREHAGHGRSAARVVQYKNQCCIERRDTPHRHAGSHQSLDPARDIPIGPDRGRQTVDVP